MKAHFASRVLWPLAVWLFLSSAQAGLWTASINVPPESVNTMLLLSDGTVMAHGGLGRNWYRLTPSSVGSYTQGTWTTLAPMQYDRLYFSSVVLTDGRVFVAGGEYPEDGPGGATAEVYNPLTNVWTPAPIPVSLLDPSQSQRFADACAKILPDGTVLISPVGPSTYGGTLIYSPSTNTWSAGPTLANQAYFQAEASWVKLPDDSILTIDFFSTTTQRYIPSQRRWVSDTPVPVPIYDGNSYEIGAALLLPSGRAFFLGATGHTVIYTPGGGLNPGTWVAGPDIPNGQGTPDAPAAMMTNGKVLCAVSAIPTASEHYPSPTSFYEYDPAANAFTQVPAPGNAAYTADYAPFNAVMLDLPNGAVLYSSQSTQLYAYQSAGPALTTGLPAISRITRNADGSYHLTGTGLNGLSEGAAYGDDAQMDTNYPLVRLSDASGRVYYARTYFWSSTSVMTGARPMSTEFVLPPGLPPGNYSLVVTASGLASNPVMLSTRTIKDINTDGTSDVIWQNTQTGQRDIWTIRNARRYQSTALDVVPVEWSIAGVGDFNGDGQADIVWQNTRTGERDLWLMQGAGRRAVFHFGVIPVEWQAAGVGDFNGDGQADIVWQNTRTGERDLWLMRGTALAQVVYLATVPTVWQIAAAGDLDRDGTSDLLWQNVQTGQRDAWTIVNARATGIYFFANVPVAWKIAGIGDFNGDGRNDVVWQNANNGDRDIWLLGEGTYQPVRLDTVPVAWSITDH